MALICTQALLARLYTDPEFREEFLSSPESAGRTYGIEAHEAIALSERCGDDARRFARSLHSKRYAEARPILPRTFEYLGSKLFHEHFLMHAAAYLPRGTNKPRDDAIAFVRWLSRNPGLVPGVYRRVRGIARCESARLEMAGSRTAAFRCCFIPAGPKPPAPAELHVWIGIRSYRKHLAFVFSLFPRRHGRQATPSQADPYV